MLYQQKFVNYINDRSQKALKRYTHASKPETKKLRKINADKKRQLKNRKEKAEKNTYSSNIELFDEPMPETSSEVVQSFRYNTDDTAVVFFDLETNNLSMSCEILQIAMKSENKVFSIYITPFQNIDSNATNVHGLSTIGRKMFLNGVEVPTIARRKAMVEMLTYLKSFEKKIVVVAHNCTFDSRRLIRLAEHLQMVEELKNLLLGFVDTLILF